MRFAVRHILGRHHAAEQSLEPEHAHDRRDILAMRRGPDAVRHASIPQTLQEHPHAGQRVQSAFHHDLAIRRLLAQREPPHLRRLTRPVQELRNNPFVLLAETGLEMPLRQHAPFLAGQPLPTRLMLARRVDDHPIPVKKDSDVFHNYTFPHARPSAHNRVLSVVIGVLRGQKFSPFF